MTQPGFILLSRYIAPMPKALQATMVRCVSTAASTGQLTCARNGLTVIAGEHTHDLFLYLDESTLSWLDTMTDELKGLISPARDTDQPINPLILPHLTPELVRAMCEVKPRAVRPAQKKDAAAPAGAGRPVPRKPAVDGGKKEDAGRANPSAPVPSSGNPAPAATPEAGAPAA